jgi:hypothetical protein
MDELRATVKGSRFRYADIAQISGNSPSWISEVLRGNYPYRGACQLPKNIRVALQQLGFVVPEIIWTY